MTGSDDNREENAGHIPHDMRGSDDSGADTERILKAKYEVWQYRDDGSKFLDDVETVESVPIAELEQLADEFEERKSYAMEPRAESAWRIAWEQTMELIADYRGDKSE